MRTHTLALYRDACCMYETDHGIADFDFEMQRMTSGYIMGCVLSTVESKGDRFKEVMQPFADGVSSQVGSYPYR